MSAELRNPKHRAVAEAFIRDPQRIGWKAYKAVFPGTSKHAAETSWSRLLKRAEFSAYLDQLKAAAADATVMSLREVLAEQSKIGRADMRDFVQIGTADSVHEAVNDLAPEQSAAIQEITVETYLEGHGDDAKTVKKVKFKLHSKASALAELRAHHEPHKHEHTGKDGKPIEVKSAPPTDLELVRRIHFILTKASRATAPPSKEKRK